jgi:hypothetical protein
MEDGKLGAPDPWRAAIRAACPARFAEAPYLPSSRIGMTF